jgi:hypothetical protein
MTTVNSVATTPAHSAIVLDDVRKTFGARNRAEAVRLAEENGWLLG